MSDFLKKFGLFEKKSITHKIRGQKFEFHPVSLCKVATGRLAALMVPLTDAVATLLNPKREDVERLQEVSPDGAVFTRISCISREMAMYRDSERRKAIDSAWNMLLNDDTRHLVAQMLMDSLRDDCPRNPSEDDVTAFIDHDDMDVPTIVEFLKGFMRANANIFGETGKELAALVKAKVEAATKEALEPEPPLDVRAKAGDEKGDEVEIEQDAETPEKPSGEGLL